MKGKIALCILFCALHSEYATGKQRQVPLKEIRPTVDLILAQKVAEACQQYRTKGFTTGPKRKPGEKVNAIDGFELSRAYMHSIQAVCAASQAEAESEASEATLFELKAAQKNYQGNGDLSREILEVYSISFLGLKIHKPKECGIVHWYMAINLFQSRNLSEREKQALMQVYLMNGAANECDAMQARNPKDARMSLGAAREHYEKILTMNPPEPFRKTLTKRISEIQEKLGKK
jgi:hypothetical protein